MKKMMFLTWSRKKNNTDFLNSFKKNKVFYMIISFLALGIILGTFCVFNIDKNTSEKLYVLFSSNLKNRASKTLLDLFILSLSSSFLLLLVEFFLGLSIWGGFLVPFILFFRGFSIGYSAGYLCYSLGIKGLVFYSLVILPSCFISTFALLILCKEAIKSSFYLINKSFPNLSLNKKDYNLKIYFLRTGFCFVLITISALAEILCCDLFSNLLKI